jgi:hypothetical protein
MTGPQSREWKTYEDVAQHLLDAMAHQFGLGRVEGKQVIPGEGGAKWQIDAKGVTDDEGAFVIIERRRHTNKGVSQEQVGGLAYRIQTTGAAGGIIVTPLPLQSGAAKVAKHEGIISVELTPDSTTTDFVIRFLERMTVGKSLAIGLGQNVGVEPRVIRAPKIPDPQS